MKKKAVVAAFEPHPLDVLFGLRVRAVRKATGMSMNALAIATGITFQQIQKYESGANRVSFSRSIEIARALGIDYLELVTPIVPRSDGKSNSDEIEAMALIGKSGVLELVRVFTKLPRKFRVQVLHVAQALLPAD